ncbi:MAG: hypothetical protein H6832_09745 [Planctomycetes bacterium]|nr:hypothetical protein [Planctomycetota bacterium]MCB9918673.1 hypothetical protein [Planctomycetota bacterium]
MKSTDPASARRRHAKPLVALLAVVAFGACTPPAATPPAVTARGRTFVDELNHRWFPLEPRAISVFEGEESLVHRLEVERVLPGTVQVAGIDCHALHKDVYLDDGLVETSTEYYAQDSEGNVWKFGEESLEVHDGKLRRSEDSWRVGSGAAYPWIAFPAEMRVGDEFEGFNGIGIDLFVVAATDVVAETPMGTFGPCLRLLENPDDPEDRDILLYAPGVGRVGETSTRGRVTLVDRR